MNTQYTLLTIFLLVSSIYSTIYILDSDGTTSNVQLTDAPCSMSVLVRQPITFGNFTGQLAYETMTKEQIDGKILVIHHADPMDVRIKNYTSGISIIGVISIGPEVIPGYGMYQVYYFKDLGFPYVEVSSLETSIINYAISGYNVTVDDLGENQWKAFYDNGIFYVFQVIIIAGNTVLLSLLAYSVILVSRVSKQYIQIAGIVLESIGALARVIFYIDPSGCYRLIPTEISGSVFYACFPFTLANCLLNSLYFQETLSGKDIVLTYFIKKTRWLFYLVLGILFVLILVIPITRTFVFFSQVRLIVVIGFIIISTAIAVLYIVTAVQLFQTLNKLDQGMKESRKRLLAVRFIITAIVLIFMIITMIISRITRTPAIIEVMGSLVVALITAVGLLCAITLVSLTAFKPKPTETKATKTQTQAGDTKRKSDEEDEVIDMSSEKKDDDDEDSEKKETSKKESGDDSGSN